jgi:hypothetical protein
MRPNSASLTMRDPAMAALMGALPGPNFGAVRAPRAGFRGSSNPTGRGRGRATADFGFGFGDDAGADVSADYGDDAGAEAGFGHHKHHKAHHGHHKHPHIAAHERMLAETHHRMRMLDPNGSSRVKIEGYSFPFGQNITLGTAAAINATLQPNAMIKPVQVFMNAPSYGFVTISSLLIANVNAILGTSDDAGNYSAQTLRTYTKLPLLDMSTRATVAGAYTGLVPPGFASSFVYPFTVTIMGPAVLAGNAPPSLI